MADIDPRLSPALLSVLDSLWAIDTRINVIQHQLYLRSGETFEFWQIRDAANRYADVPAAAPIARQPEAPAQAVRRVAPGTFPARGFSMLGGRVV